MPLANAPACLSSISFQPSSTASPSFEAGPFPVVSLYLNMQPDQNGRDQFEPFLKKELAERLRTYPASGPERESLEKDAAKIREYVAGVDPSVERRRDLRVRRRRSVRRRDARRPASGASAVHLGPAASVPAGAAHRRVSALRRAPGRHALGADLRRSPRTPSSAPSRSKASRRSGTRWAAGRRRATSATPRTTTCTTPRKSSRRSARIVRDESIDSIVMAGDDVIVPLLKEQLPKDLAERVVDVVKLEARASEREVLEKTIAALREKDVETDREKVDELLGAYRANGLAVVGVEATRKALETGQVDELIITASPTHRWRRRHGPMMRARRTAWERAADELVARARRPRRRCAFIEDAALLDPRSAASARFCDSRSDRRAGVHY